MSVSKLVENATFDIATGYARQVSALGDYSWESHGGTWSINYWLEEPGTNAEGEEFYLEDDPTYVEYDGVCLTFVDAADIKYDVGNSLMGFSLPDGSRIGVDNQGLEYETVDDLVGVLGALVRSGEIEMDDAIEAMEEDERNDFDDQDITLFKVKYS